MDGDDKTPKCHSNDASGPTESLRYAWETSCGYPEAKFEQISGGVFMFAPNHLNYAREVNVFVTSKD